MSLKSQRLVVECDVCQDIKATCVLSSEEEIAPGWARMDVDGPDVGITDENRYKHARTLAMIDAQFTLLPPELKAAPEYASQRAMAMLQSTDSVQADHANARLNAQFDVCPTCMNSDDAWSVLRRRVLAEFATQARPLDGAP